MDLGSPNLIAGKADGAENVIRVKATVKNFREETNMSVITENGAFYTFNVKYADEPLLLNVEMTDFIHDGASVNRPNNALEVYLKELGSESPMLVRLIMKSIHKENRRTVKHIGSKAFGIQYLLRGLYSHNGLLYFHTELRNKSNVPFDIDFITFKIVDKKVAKQIAMQEQVLLPLRAYNYVTCVAGQKSGRTVFTLQKFTIPDDKHLIVVMLTLFAGQAHAQRCLPKMKGIRLTAGMADGFYSSSSKNETGYTFGASLATYTKGGHQWVLGAEYLRRYHPYRESRIPVEQFTGEGGFLCNVLSNGSKTFFLSAGVSAVAGYETINGGKKLLFDGSTLRNKDGFLYGGAVTLQAEIYLTDRLVLLLYGRERYLWGGSTERFHTQYGVGLKIMLD